MRKASRRARSRRQAPVPRNLLASATAEAPLEPVSVRISKEGLVVDRRVKLFKGRNQGLKFVAQDEGGPWRITFKKNSSEPSTYPIEKDKSPFDEPQFDVPKGDHKLTGPPNKGNPKKTYRYKVSDPSDGYRVTDDPDVDVE